jgi:hypothetical protein
MLPIGRSGLKECKAKKNAASNCRQSQFLPVYSRVKVRQIKLPWTAPADYNDSDFRCFLGACPSTVRASPIAAGAMPQRTILL